MSQLWQDDLDEEDGECVECGTLHSKGKCKVCHEPMCKACYHELHGICSDCVESEYLPEKE